MSSTIQIWIVLKTVITTSPCYFILWKSERCYILTRNGKAGNKMFLLCLIVLHLVNKLGKSDHKSYILKGIPFKLNSWIVKIFDLNNLCGDKTVRAFTNLQNIRLKNLTRINIRGLIWVSGRFIAIFLIFFVCAAIMKFLVV